VAQAFAGATSWSGLMEACRLHPVGGGAWVAGHQGQLLRCAFAQHTLLAASLQCGHALHTCVGNCHIVRFANFEGRSVRTL